MIESISDQSTFKVRSLESRKAISVSANHDDLWTFCPNSNKRPWSTQGAYFWSHARPAYQRIKINHGLSIDVPNHLLYFSHTQCRIQKVGGYQSMLHTACITCSMRIAAYEKQEALDQRSIQLLLLSTRASPCTKNKGLDRYVLHI
jgi:hypothetical protein